MKKLILLALAVAVLLSTGCGTLRKLWTSDETQAAIAADVQKLAGTDKLAAKFDAAEERQQLSYAFLVLSAQKAGITETDARDFLAGRSDDSENSDDSDVPADLDAVDFASLVWKFGGVDGSKAKLSAPRISGLKAGKESISYKWDVTLSAWGLDDDDSDNALACWFVTREDGSIVGGKFDWISTSRKTRDFKNVLTGYQGWSLEGVPNPCQAYFVVVSKDARKRSNIVATEWKR